MPTPTLTLILFRHGETDWNAEERFQGHIDIILNETGRAQARALAESLRQAKLTRILSSDLARAHETATIVAQTLNLPLHLDPRLREAHLGGAQGMTRAEIEAQYGAELVSRWRSWQATDADVAYPGGETGTQVTDRVFAAMEDFARTLPADTAAGISTHGGVIRRVMQKLSPPGTEPVPIPNGVVYKIRFDAESRMWTLNQP